MGGLPGLAQDRDEGLRKGPFGEKPSQEIGDLEGNEEGIRAAISTKEASDQEISGKSQEA